MLMAFFQENLQFWKNGGKINWCNIVHKEMFQYVAKVLIWPILSIDWKWSKSILGEWFNKIWFINTIN